MEKLREEASNLLDLEKTERKAATSTALGERRRAESLELRVNKVRPPTPLCVVSRLVAAA